MAHRNPVIHGCKEPSVTQVIAMLRMPFLERWRGLYGNAACDRVMKQSGKFGTTVHDCIDAGLKNKFFALSPPIPRTTYRQKQMVKLFWDWQELSRFTPIKTELFVISRMHRYGGTFDALGFFGDDKETLFFLDWKTSSSIEWSYGMQLAAYAQAYFEETGVKVDQGGIIRLEKKPAKFPQLEVKTFNDLFERHLPPFLALREVYEHMKKKEKRALW